MFLTTPAAETIQWRQTASTSIASIVLNDVKTWINRPVEDNFWDEETTTLILTAQRAIEAHCQMTLSTSTWVGTMSKFYDRFRINKRPFLSVEGISYVEADTGEIKTLSPSLYQWGPINQMCGQIARGDGGDWPNTASRLDAVRITIKTGFVAIDGVTPELPVEVMHALKMTVSELDGSRGDEDGTNGGGGSKTVYAMKQNRSGYLGGPIRDLLAPYAYASVFAV